MSDPIALHERDKVREMLATEGAQIIAAKLLNLVSETQKAQLQMDPFTQASDIAKAQRLTWLIKTELPNLLNAIVNYEEEKKFDIWEWLKEVLKK